MKILLLSLLLLQIHLCVFAEENSAYVESSEFRKSKEQVDTPSAATGQVVLRRRVVRKKIAPTTTPQPSQVEDETTTRTEKTRRPLFAARNQRPPFKTSSLKSQIGKITEGTTKKKFQPLNKKTTTTTTAEPQVVETSREEEEENKNNSSMIIIPVPPSQRKPYHPVIMQVTKAPPTETARVVTYKLNKMFVPLGIYGKVLASNSSGDSETQDSSVSTPMPFLMPGQDKNKSEISVRHKGTESKEEEKEEGGSGGKWENLLREIKAKNSKTRKSKDHQRIADTIDITYNYRPDVNKISLTTPRMDISSISLTTEMPVKSSPDLLHSSSDNRKQWTNHYHGNKEMTMLHPPAMTTTSTPQKKVSFGASTFVDSIKDAASNIPSLFHKGITSLSSLTTALSSENPFHDETFSSSDNRPVYSSILAAVPGGFVAMPSQVPKTTTVSPAEAEYETLEYFRNRPHLINKAGRKHFREPSYFSSGFRPVTPPSFMARDYYASTTNIPRDHKKGDQATAASSNSWNIIDPNNRESKMMPTEDDAPSSWATIFQAKEYGDKPAETSSWRSFFGLAPNTEESTVHNSAMMEGGRRRELVLESKWEEIRRKYSRKELAEAKERLYEIVSTDSSPYEVYGKIPVRAGSALRDLFNMFKIGVNFSSGKSSSPVLNFDKQPATHFGDSSWTPLTKAGGPPLITFSAGITFKGGHVPPTASNFLRGGSHFSSSSRPFTPYKYNGHKHHLVDLSHSYVTKATPTILSHDVSSIGSGLETESYGSELPAYGTVSSPVVESAVEEVEESVGGEGAYGVSGGYTASGGYGASGGHTASGGYTADDDNHFSPSSYQQVKYSDDDNAPAYELVPSDVFFSQKNPDMSNVAAVIKPSDISDDLVKAHLPQEISGVPTLDFPTRQLPKHAAQKFSSLSQLQNYLATAEPKATTKIPLQYQQQLPQRPQSVQVTPQTFQQIQYQQLQSFMQPQQQQQQQQHQIVAQFQPQQQPFQFNSFNNHNMQILHSGSNGQKVTTSGDKTVGFSDFELPANIDPDIASLLKSELDKDDIPEEFRQDFEDAKKEEAAKKSKAAVSSAQSSRRNDNVNPFLMNHYYHHHQQQQSSHPQQQSSHPQQQTSHPQQPVMRYPPRQLNLLSHYNNYFHLPPPVPKSLVAAKPISKFHAPVPISPTMMTSQWRGQRYNSPVPRYVIELAKKLQKDSDVQGIVRVSTKRGRGPPIEYLYPVRG